MIRVNRGTRPPGFTSMPEAWAEVRTSTGAVKIAALMRRIDFDGTQACTGEDLFIAEQAYTADDIDYMTDLCESCPFMRQCREWSLAHDLHNFYAGMTARQRVLERERFSIMYVQRDNPTVAGLIPEPTAPVEVSA